MSDAMIMQALVESDAADEPAPIDLPRDVPSAEQSAVRLRRLFPRSRMIRMVSAAAAIIVLCLGTFWWISSRPVASLTASVGSVWEQARGADVGGRSFLRAKHCGSLRVSPNSSTPAGQRSSLKRPATFVLNSRDRMTLLHGRLTAMIPAPAHGFTVSTPAGKIVDLGTEFGVNVVSESVVETRVFQGRIQVQAKDDATQRR